MGRTLTWLWFTGLLVECMATLRLVYTLLSSQVFLDFAKNRTGERAGTTDGDFLGWIASPLHVSTSFSASCHLVGVNHDPSSPCADGEVKTRVSPNLERLSPYTEVDLKLHL